MRVLITGITGSLGNALTRHLLAHTDWRVVGLSRDELKQAQMRERIPDPRLDFRLGDVRDLRRLKLAFHGINLVIHAAALKRVDAVANDPDEALQTNVVGTRNVLDAALVNRVPKVLLISSDKAVEPANFYGFTKGMAEQLAVTHNTYGYPSGCLSSVIRYGNVLGSRGSVIHIWRQQLADGLPLTVTDPNATRFIVTLDQIVELVHRAVEVMRGGEVFVPRLPAVSLGDLAHAMGQANWRLMPYRPGGEKPHELLMSSLEQHRAVDAEDFAVVQPHWHSWCKDVPWSDAPLMTVDGRWSSQSCQDRLTPEQLKPLIDAVPEGGV